MLSRALAIWLLLLVLATANGLLREGVLLQVLPRTMAFVCGGLLLITTILVVSALTIHWLGRLQAGGYLLVGLSWLALTVCFEFGFGLARGRSMTSLLDAYRFRDGDIWPIVLLAIALAPLIAAHVRGLLVTGGAR
jgi:hypothetical protein